MDETKLLQRIAINPAIFGGKPIMRGRRLAVEHVLDMLAAGDTTESLLQACPWLEAVDIQACLVYARRTVAMNALSLLPLSRLLESPSGFLHVRECSDGPSPCQS
ncbi:MAG: DUF433 domain-containing protein [Chloroflexi bacterium]|nr:DUF433 domain-containing protein [Chloroflexota bacterium]